MQHLNAGKQNHVPRTSANRLPNSASRIRMPRIVAGRLRIPCMAALILFGTALPVRSQGFTKADSGWVPLFNGQNYQGLYSRLYNKPVTTTVDPAFKITYAGTDSVEIRIASIGGEIGTVRSNYKHYRMRIQYRFDAPGNLNAGFLYAMDETYPRMGGDGTVAKGNWPRSIECQMLQGDGGDAFSIQQVTFDTRVTNGRWDPKGKPIKVCEHGCDGRDFGATPDKADFPGPAWNDMEVVVRGADTAIHIVNGKEVFKLWNIRTTNDSGVTLAPWDSGAVGLEAENAIVHYRRWEIMELPEAGPNSLVRLFLTNPIQGTAFTAGSKTALTWKTLGDAKKVSVFYDLGAGGGWVMAADNINNAGSFSWTVPDQTSDKLRIKVSAAPWVRPDSSGEIRILKGTGLADRGARPRAGNPSGPALEETSGSQRDARGRSPGGKRRKAFRSIGFRVP